MTTPGPTLQPATQAPLTHAWPGKQVTPPQVDPQVLVPKSQTEVGPVQMLLPQVTPQVVPPEQLSPAGQAPLGQLGWQLPFWQEKPVVHAAPEPQ
jgi:hypothetical protein